MSPSHRLLPDFSPVRKILLALPFSGSDWQHNLTEALDCYAGIIKSILVHDKAVSISLLVHPGDRRDEWIETLPLTIEQRARLSLITTVTYNDTWIRDYGPLSLVNDHGAVSYRAFQFNGWGQKYPSEADNRVASQLAIKPFEKRPLVLEGGALEVNADGVLLLNEACIIDQARNSGLSKTDMEKLLIKELGVSAIEWLSGIQLEGDDTDGHIDTLARFIKNDVLVCCGESTQHHDAPALSSLVAQLEKICIKRAWQLHQLPVPLLNSKIDGRILPASYANFLICNKSLFLPVYDVAEDQQAVSILKKALPQMNIIAVPCAALVEQHGSLHCATMQLA